MSVLNTIKGKIVNVQQDISHSFRSLTTKDVAENVNVADSGAVNWNAGADLLQRYQQYWSELHHASENNAQKAQDVGLMVAKIFQFFEQQNTAMNEFLSEVSAIQLLISEVSDSKEKISKIQDSFGELETMLLELEDVCDQNELQKRKLEHEYQLAKYRQTKSFELEKNKGALAAKHASKVQQFEAQVMATLKERSRVFDDAFHEQLENYKKTGHVDVVPSPTHSPDSHTDLADIKIEDDASVLDEFLDAEDQSNGNDVVRGNDTNGSEGIDKSEDVSTSDISREFVHDADVEKLESVIRPTAETGAVSLEDSQTSEQIGTDSREILPITNILVPDVTKIDEQTDKTDEQML